MTYYRFRNKKRNSAASAAKNSFFIFLQILRAYTKRIYFEHEVFKKLNAFI